MGRLSVVLFSLCFFIASNVASADEGMWAFNNLPLKALKEKYNFEPTQEWIDHVMRSSVRFNSGGSGSFISSTGLVLTNHHVAADTLQKVSTAQKNYLKNGFLANTLADEIPAPDLELNQLISIEEVTAKVNAAVTPGMTAQQASDARRAVIAQIEKESLEKTGLRSEVVTLYQGGQYHLYRYKKYTDVRVVFAPEVDIAFFGGDPDNFNFPRYDLDMTIMRVYENGKPAKVDHFLKWSKAGAAENELIFVSGNPGRTSRLFTVAALEFQRDVRIEMVLSWLQRKENYLRIYSDQGIEETRRARDELFSTQNSRKVYIGRTQGLHDQALFREKQRAEYELRAAVAADPKLQQFAGAWDKVALAQKEHKKLLKKRNWLESGWAFDTTYFTYARQIVRMAEEDLKDNKDRLPEYRDSARESLEQELFSTAPLYDDFEQYKLQTSLSFLVEEFGSNDLLVKAVLKGKDPMSRAAELISETTLKTPGVRRLLGKGEAKAKKKLVDGSYDPMLELARIVDKASRGVRKQYEQKVVESELAGYAQIANALFATKGTSIYPDATFTLRLSYGVVKGYEEKGANIPAWTTMGGAFEHEVAHGGIDPWKLPASWHLTKGTVDLKTPFNFVSTADIIGGNSGSPVINKDGELVGLIFDGNIQSLTGDFVYTDKQSRAVSVHSSGMLEALKNIYNAGALADELGR